MSLTTLVTFVEVFSINENSVRDSKYFLQNAKRGKFDDMTLAGETNDAQINIENKVAENSIRFDSGTVPGRGLQTYYYLPFIYQGTTINKSGDNIESNLIMGNHPLSMAKAQQTVLNKYFVEVNVCIMKNDDIGSLQDTDSQGNSIDPNRSILTTDTWLASSLSYDPEVVEVLLSSAIDSVGGNVPSLVLTTDVVGKLPVTSDIQNR
jgi:hypothetical protein